MKRFVLTLIVLAMVVTLASTALAQAQQSLLANIVEIHVKPGMGAEYEAARAAIVESWTRNKFSYGLTESRGENSIYRRFFGIEDMADLDKRTEERLGFGPLDRDVMDRLNRSIDHTTSSMVRTRPELYYTPENPRLGPGEARFYRYVYLYPRRGTIPEVMEGIAKYKAVWEKHGETDRFIVTQAVRGPDLPMILVRFSARDAADFYAQDKRRFSEFGDEVAPIVAEVLRLCRRIESSNNVVLPEISYQPPASN